MNLYTPADGLFGTHVTWEDIEEDMQRELDTIASFGPNKTAKEIGEGNGFMSRMVLIDPDWQHKDKELPEKFIVKILTQLVMQEVTNEMSKQMNVDNSFIDPQFSIGFEAVQKNCHNAEVTTYSHLLKIPKAVVNIPKIYYMKKFTEWNPVKGYIIMEYLKDVKGVHIFENVSPKQVKQILRHKAVMEANSLDIPSEERKMFIQSLFKDLFSVMFKKEVMKNYMSMFRSFGREKLAENFERLQEIIWDIVDLEWADNLASEFGMEPVLCHGDLWSMNILWRQQGDEINMAAVIDYQTAHFGCSATDLVRLFSACLSGEDRRAHWEQLTEEFYGYLKEEIGSRKMPYTLEQLKEAQRQYFPMGAFMVVPMVGPLFEAVCKYPDEELKKKCLETAIEKTECLLDDIFYYHERNMKIGKQKKVA